MFEVYGTETKKMLNILVLDVLKRYSDADHPLTQQAIIRILKSDYGVEKIDRRSVKANVLSLSDMGYEISMEEGDGYYLMSRDFKMHDQGRDYLVNPYQMVASNGFYYLLGNLDKYDDVSYYRIDKMTDVKILEDRRKPQKEVQGLGERLNLSKHMAEHIYMFSGESENVTIKTTPEMMDALVDWFGKDFKILEKTEDELIIKVRCNAYAMNCWALQYGPYVEVLEPKSLRKNIADDIKNMYEKYRYSS